MLIFKINRLPIIYKHSKLEGAFNRSMAVWFQCFFFFLLNNIVFIVCMDLYDDRPPYIVSQTKKTSKSRQILSLFFPRFIKQKP